SGSGSPGGLGPLLPARRQDAAVLTRDDGRGRGALHRGRRRGGLLRDRGGGDAHRPVERPGHHPVHARGHLRLRPSALGGAAPHARVSVAVSGSSTCSKSSSSTLPNRGMTFTVAAFSEAGTV